MKKLGLRFGIHKYWKNLYYTKLMESKKDPIPNWKQIEEDKYIERVLEGFWKNKKIEIQKYRDVINIYVSDDKLLGTEIRNVLNVERVLKNVLKCKVNIRKLYTFSIEEVNLLLPLMIKNKEKLEKIKELWKKGKIRGFKMIIKGRYKKGNRTQTEVIQYGKIPNTPTTKLEDELFYTQKQIIQNLGVSSMHIYIYYK